MPRRNRHFVPAMALLFAALQGWPATASPTKNSTETSAEQQARLKVLRCGQERIRTGRSARPKDLHHAKSLLGENCMAEFNEFVAQANIATARNASIGELNSQFVSIASDLLGQIPPAGMEAGDIGAAQRKNRDPDPARAAGSIVTPATMPRCEGSVSAGLKAFESGDFDLALCHWMPRALAGDAAAQNNVGTLFEFGLTSQTPESDVEAAQWYLQSARQEFAPSMRHLFVIESRAGNEEAANYWLERAFAAERRNDAIRERLLADYDRPVRASPVCTVEGCPMPGMPEMPSAGGRGSRPLIGNSTRRSRIGLSGDEFGLGLSRRSAPNRNRVALPTLCPNGTYASGPCNIAPDGTYVSGRPTLAPNGKYVGGTPTLMPRGTYVGGNGRVALCPDGSYVGGDRCVLAPNGRYVGQ